MKKEEKKFEGSVAPQFTLVDQFSDLHKLKDYLGQRVVLYFYPKDMTSGCTTEALGFQSLLSEFAKLDVLVFGISKDDKIRHQKFAKKEGLKFKLLVDVNRKVCDKYGVWVEKSMYGKKYMGIARETFIIDETGIIIKHFKNVKPSQHPQDVLDYIKEIK